MKKTLCGKASFLLILLLFLASLLGCGKKGPPVPDHSRDTFAFKDLSAQMALDGTATFSGQLSGSVQNLAFLILEIEAVTDELCEGCPFLAQDVYRVEPDVFLVNEAGTDFRFVYRPLFPGKFYRWRLVGHNVYSGTPSEVSPLQTLRGDGLAVDVTSSRKN